MQCVEKNIPFGYDDDVVENLNDYDLEPFTYYETTNHYHFQGNLARSKNIDPHDTFHKVGMRPETLQEHEDKPMPTLYPTRMNKNYGHLVDTNQIINLTLKKTSMWGYYGSSF